MTISRSAKTVLAAFMLALTVMLIMPACAFADDTEEHHGEEGQDR